MCTAIGIDLYILRLKKKWSWIWKTTRNMQRARHRQKVRHLADPSKLRKALPGGITSKSGGSNCRVIRAFESVITV